MLCAIGFNGHNIMEERAVFEIDVLISCSLHYALHDNSQNIHSMFIAYKTDPFIICTLTLD